MKITCTPHILTALLASAMLLLPLAATAATGDPDSFNPNPDSGVYAAAVQLDGKVLLGGDFNLLGTAFGQKLARINLDGSPDAPFNPTVGPTVNGRVVCTAVQGDGKVLLGGIFSFVASWPRTNLARLNADGTMDFGFNSSVFNAPVSAVALQPDGKIVVGGAFTTVSGAVRLKVARLSNNGALEAGFDPSANGDVNSVVIQPDGKILLGGYFTGLQPNGGASVGRNRLARLNADGTVDAGFNPDVNNAVTSLALQVDGKVLLGGEFTSVAGTNRNHFARVNADGTLDAGFNPDCGARINSLAVQADGKIIAGGVFTNIGGAARTFVARVLSNGALDASFNPNISGGEVNGVSLQSDGRVLMGGYFFSVGGQTRNNFARLENDAATQSLTASNASRVQWLRGGTAPESHAVTFELSTNGGTTYTLLGSPTRISGGWELTGLSLPIGGALRARARVTGGAYGGSAGWIENVALFGFQPEIAVSGNGVSIAAGDNSPSLSDGTDFGNVNLASGGSVVHTFAITNSGNTNLFLGSLTIGGTNAADFSVTSPPATNLAAGASTTFQITFAPTAPGLRSATLSFTNNDLSENPFTFSLQGTFNFEVDGNFNPDANLSVYNAVVQPDGQIVLGGQFTRIGGVVRYCLARLNADGTLSSSLSTNLPNYDDWVRGLALQPDGRVLLGGYFQIVGGYLRPRMARLNTDGTTDPIFYPNPNTDYPKCFAVQRDGKILTSGSWSAIGGGSSPNLARLNPDGTLDTNFLATVNGPPYSIAVQPDGKILLGGTFSTVNGAGRAGLVRLNADGTLDNGFNFGSSSNAYPSSVGVFCVALQGDGKILFGGQFTSIVGAGPSVGRNHIARLNADGTLDLSFNPNANNDVNSIAVQANGKILLAGTFTTVGGAPRNRSARLNADGTLDTTFDPNANDEVRGVALQADGRVLLVGDFTSVGGVARNRVARMINEAATESLTVPSASRVQWLRGGSSPESQLVSFEVSTNGGSVYAPLGFAARISGGWELTGLSLPAAGHLRARAQTTGGYYSGSCGYVEAVSLFGNLPQISIFTGASTAAADRRTNNVGTNLFAATIVGSNSAAQTFTIKNVGNTNLTGLVVTLAGANSGDFVLGALGTNALAPNATTTFTVTFRPVTNGLRNAVAFIASNDPFANPFAINVSGTGLAPEIAVFTGGTAPANERTNNVGTNVFATTLLGGSSAAQTFTIQNIGDANLAGLTVTLTGANSGDFVLGTLGTNSLVTNAATTFTVSFQPVAAGVRNALVSIASNDGDENPFKINVSGVGITPKMTVLGNNVSITNNSTPSLANHTDFGSVAFSTTLVRTFTITNSGTAALTLGSVTVGGTGAADFSVTAQPAATVPTNGSTTFQVTFHPSVFGLRSASLSFTNSDLNAPSFNFGIQATGIASSDANLAALTLSRGTLSPSFATATTNYTASVANSDTNLTVTATRAQTNATLQLQINGAGYVPLASGSPSAPLALDVGTNTVNVRVTAQDGTTAKTYSVTVTRRALAAGDLDPLDLALTGNVNLIVIAMAVQPDGKTIIAGIFDSVLGVARTNIARLNADGTLDMSFDPNPNADVGNVVVQADGKVLIGGSFSALQPNGAASATTRKFLARLNSDGTVDAGFDPSPNSYIDGMAVQPDGKVLLCGRFTSLQPNGGAVTNRNRIARLNADGSLDTGFDPNANNTVWSLALQPDGKVLAGGQFTSLQPNGGAVTNRNRIARLNADGTLDTGFDPNANNQVWSLALQPDGKVLLGGAFTALQPNGAASATARNYIARINSDGTLDPGFDPRANNSVTCLALQADGQVLAGGLFGNLQPYGSNSVIRRFIARLKPDGTVDADFNPNPNPSPSPNGYVYGVALQADGKVLLGGVFSTLQPNGASSPVTRLRFARLLNDPAIQSLTATNTSEIHWMRGGSSPEISQVTFELSTNNGASWTLLGNGLRVGTTAEWQINGLTLPTSGLLRARGRTTSDGYIGCSSGVIESVTNFSIGVQVASPVINPQSLKILGDGAFQFSFSNADNVAFNVLAATNVNLPLGNWSVLGVGTNLGGGLYQFTDPAATNFPRRFYRLHYP